MKNYAIIGMIWASLIFTSLFVWGVVTFERLIAVMLFFILHALCLILYEVMK